MTERLRKQSYSNAGYISGKMATDFGLSPRKTMLVLVIVVGCFAVLWPKVFYPMLVGSANRHIKPSPIDRTKGCCDVISETDVHTLEIMSEICNTIIKKDEDSSLTGRELIQKCRSDILETCGIDISSVLQEQVRLGQTTKQILDEVRSLNGSLCLKYNFGVSPGKLGVPHRVIVQVSPSYRIKQERPPHLRSEMVHPAFRERGRAIPQPEPSHKPSPPSRLIPKVVVPGRPGPIPSMRPTMGGAGHVVPPPKQGTGSMGFIMPIYTIGIVIFFTYTVMKVMFKKQPEALYPPVEPDPIFRKHVFEPERIYVAPKTTKDGVSSKLVVNAMSALLDEVDQELSSLQKANGGTAQDVVANGGLKNQDEDQASVKVVGMETTASCEGGRRWSRPESPVLSSTNHQAASDPIEPPQEIYLEGALPPQSHLLVTDSATEAHNVNSDEDPAVVLAGKMTLSVISLDSSENGTDESSNSGRKYGEERSSSNVSEDFEKIEIDPQLEEQIDEIIEKARNIGIEQSLLEEIRKEMDEDREEEEITNEATGNVEELEEVDIQTNGEIRLVEEEAKEQIDQISETSNEFNHEKQANVDLNTDINLANENIVPLEGEIAQCSQQYEVNITEKLLPQGELKQNGGNTLAENEETLITEKIVADDVILLEKEASTLLHMVTEENVPQPQGIEKLTDTVAEEKLEEDSVSVSTIDSVIDTFSGQEEPKQKTDKSEKEHEDKLEQAENVEVAETDSLAEPITTHELKETVPSKPHGSLDRAEIEKANNEDDEGEEEEIEYEYEESDNEDVDEEIRNAERLGDSVDVGEMNGRDHEQSKNGERDVDDIAESDISDEESSEDQDADMEDDEEVEEIIEYVTDEEEEIEVVEPLQRNSVNYHEDGVED
ncbi:hypothetical protein JTB14_020094 [Gonioctena quinquepunctata]|nr:hypothetical protein JTB14_020094 [Gonioctena quinquepunctata]